MDRRQFLKLLALISGFHEAVTAHIEQSSWYGDGAEAMGREMMDGLIAGLDAAKFVKLKVGGEDFYIPMYSKEQVDEL